MSLAPLGAITGLFPGDPTAADASGATLSPTGALDTGERPSIDESTRPDFAGIMLQALAAAPPQNPTGPLLDLAQLTLLISGKGEQEPVAADGEPVRGTEPPQTPQTVPQLARADRAIEKLDPELVSRIRRVTERLLVEHGHEVELVEGYRSPERQEFLFAQGRTTPGPVVTWTRQSMHSRGRAADLQIDGTWENAEAYRVLQQIAEEEGLATLGMKDPGHIQLAEAPGRLAHRADARLQVFAPREDGSTTGGARIAVPARVAAAAAVARVGQVAAVAQPGVHIDARRTVTASTPSDATARPTLPTSESLPIPESPKLPGIARVAADGPPLRMAPARGDLEGSKSTVVAETAPVDAPPPPPSQPAGLVTYAEPVRSTASAPPVDPSHGAERVARIQNLQDLAAAAPGRIHVSLDVADGAGTRINLTLRGSAVDASIQLEDPAAARQMTSRISELHSALRRRGLEPASLRVQHLPPRVDIVELAGAPRSTAADATLLTSEAEASSQRHPNGQSRETLRDPREEPRRFQQRPKSNPESEAKQ